MKRLPTLDSRDSISVQSLNFEPSARSELPAFTAGQIWRVIAPGVSGERYVVVVISRHGQDENSLVVAPTSSQVWNATELDLIIEPSSSLRYHFIVCPWNFGVVRVDQFDEFLGQLPDEGVTELHEMFRFILSGAPISPSPHVGPVVKSSDDERLIWRSEQIAALKPLYAPWASRFDDADSKVEEAPSERLSAAVSVAMESEGHDIGSLAEAAHVSRASVSAVLDDRLDLTDQRDVDDVAAVFRALSLSFGDIEAALAGTLQAQAGGVRVGRTATERIAARKRPGISANKADKVLREGLSEIDESLDARARAISDYLRAVSDRLD